MSYLEINHINGGGSKEWRTRRSSIHDQLLSGKRSAEGLNVLCRVCNAIDYLNKKNPHASGRIVARWEKYTNKKAVLLNGKAKETVKRRAGKAASSDQLLTS